MYVMLQNSEAYSEYNSYIEFKKYWKIGLHVKGLRITNFWQYFIARYNN